ncbi:hypothetical protein QBC38DRAFT_272195 [Podospora fimiseda]|uniref:Uncharacterized protein n=1 Tax=Podospora fimiseda TaxID=252190 RepID=A0AAN7BKX3_9PEZI|nr:hypothetical protein QBC38DRAFT_272195 [Podospora fimiseda]
MSQPDPVSQPELVDQQDPVSQPDPISEPDPVFQSDSVDQQDAVDQQDPLDNDERRAIQRYRRCENLKALFRSQEPTTAVSQPLAKMLDGFPCLEHIGERSENICPVHSRLPVNVVSLKTLDVVDLLLNDFLQELDHITKLLYNFYKCKDLDGIRDCTVMMQSFIPDAERELKNLELVDKISKEYFDGVKLMTGEKRPKASVCYSRRAARRRYASEMQEFDDMDQDQMDKSARDKLSSIIVERAWFEYRHLQWCKFLDRLEKVEASKKEWIRSCQGIESKNRCEHDGCEESGNVQEQIW